jgi:hypothetical protein
MCPSIYDIIAEELHWLFEFTVPLKTTSTNTHPEVNFSGWWERTGSTSTEKVCVSLRCQRPNRLLYELAMSWDGPIWRAAEWFDSWMVVMHI